VNLPLDRFDNDIGADCRGVSGEERRGEGTHKERTLQVQCHCPGFSGSNPVRI
jgi:hypothetical protein